MSEWGINCAVVWQRAADLRNFNKFSNKSMSYNLFTVIKLL